MSHQNDSSSRSPRGQIKPDDLWKSLIAFFFFELIHFFFPERVASKRITQMTPLDKECNQLIPHAYQRTRYADKLVKVIFDHEESHPVYFHIEIQGYKDREFSKRMYVYDYRIFDRYGEDIEKLAIFDRPSALPNSLTYSRTSMRRKLEMAYYHYKIWEADAAFLENHLNPLAQALLAVKKGAEVNNKSDQEILVYKFRMVQLLLSKGYTMEQDQNLFIFITQYVKFSDSQMELVFEEKLNQIIPKTKLMSLVELFKAKQKEAEAYAVKQALEQGLDQGKEKSILQMVENWLGSEEFMNGAISYQSIAKNSGLSVERVKQIHDEMGHK